MKRLFSAAALAATLAFTGGAAHAGNVYLTGHDPDFHAQVQASGKKQLNVALNFVTGGSYNDGSTKFLWVESYLPATFGHFVGFDGLASISVGAGNVDRVDALGLATVNFASYSAIVVASSYGGMLTSAEINALIGRSADIATFVNGGGGLAAFAECFLTTPACDRSNLAAPTTPFGFLPITVTSADTVAPYSVTPYGASLGLTDVDVSDCCTHNSFGAIGGLNVVDRDAFGVATTLAGNVKIGGGGLTGGVPEPASWALMIGGFAMAGATLRRCADVARRPRSRRPVDHDTPLVLGSAAMSSARMKLRVL